MSAETTVQSGSTNQEGLSIIDSYTRGFKRLVSVDPNLHISVDFPKNHSVLRQPFFSGISFRRSSYRPESIHYILISKMDLQMFASLGWQYATDVIEGRTSYIDLMKSLLINYSQINKSSVKLITTEDDPTAETGRAVSWMTFKYRLRGHYFNGIEAFFMEPDYCIWSIGAYGYRSPSRLEEVKTRWLEHMVESFSV